MDVSIYLKNIANVHCANEGQDCAIRVNISMRVLDSSEIMTEIDDRLVEPLQVVSQTIVIQ